MQNDLPTQIGRYRVLGLLGTGGMAEVFLAKLLGPSGFERPVVIKRILPHLAREQHFRDMFLDEARIVAGIQHQNVVHVQELCQDDGELYMVMEYLEGESAAGLARRLSSKRKLLSFGLAAHVIGEVCHGLHAAHNLKDPDGKPQNLVHRDVSPANIFITYDGGVKILDFGIAVAADRVSRTQAGQVKGKYAYMSPEQCKGKPLDRRSDVFSLGTVLYEISTCRRLFKRDSDMLTLQAICSEELVPPSKLVNNYPPDLEAVILKALARNKEERYQSALEMRRDLLEVSRNLNEGKIPEESLGRVMHKLFADRIDQKHGLLSRIRAGSDVTNVPIAEADNSIELPAAAIFGQTDSSASLSAAAFAEDLQSSSVVSIPSVAAVTTKPRVSGKLLAGVALLLVAIGAASAFFLYPREKTPAQAPERAATEAAIPPAEPELVAPPPSPAKVRLVLKSTPAGARVYVDGQPRGETPINLELSKSDEALELKVKLDGYETHVEQVTPDMDQKLGLALVKAPAAVAHDTRPRTTTTRSAPVPAPAVRKAPAKAKPKPAPVKAPKPAEEDDPYKRFN